MNSTKTLVTFLFLAILDAWYYFDKLPASVATHFDARGLPNGWQGKATVVTMDIAATVFVVALLAGVAAMIMKLPDAYFNISNRDYWLAPERGLETRERLVAFLLQVGALTLLLMRFIMHLTYVLNTKQPPGELEYLWPALVVYTILVVWLTWRLLTSFRLDNSNRPNA